MPATCVACSELTGSNGREAYFQVAPGGGNVRAAITFAVVNALLPLGKPLGIEKPAGLKNGGAWATPSSMIPILLPRPSVARVGARSAGALISGALPPSHVWY